MGEALDDHYVSASGTSMATPHVAGAAALLAQQHPNWTPEQLKATLIASAKPNPALTAYQQGAGRVDVARAITQTVTTDPVAVSFGRTRWPHAGNEPITRTVTYRNTGTTGVTLNLTLRVTGPEDAMAPAGMFRVSPATVTVPAGGTAQVSVTADTSVQSADGYWTGRLLASAGSTSVITPLAVHKEVESHDLTLIHKDATGAAADNYVSFVFRLDDWEDPVSLFDETGTVTYRLPKGRYGLTSFLWTQRGEDYELAALTQPDLRLTRDSTVTLDARTAKPIQLSVPEPSAASIAAVLHQVFNPPAGQRQFFTVGGSSFAGLSAANLGPAVADREFSTVLSNQWGKPDADGEGFNSSPYVYALSEEVPGRLPTGFVRHYQARDLATIRQEFRGEAPGGQADQMVYPEHDLAGPFGAYVALPVPLPGHRVAYVTTENVRWGGALFFSGSEREALNSGLVRYQAGREYREVWNEAPFGPAFLTGFANWEGVTRQGDYLSVDVPLRCDSAGHCSFSFLDIGHTALYRNGKLIEESESSGYGFFTVPPGSANYRTGDLSHPRQPRPEHPDRPGVDLQVWAYQRRQGGETPGGDGPVRAQAGRR